ncbi:MAG: acyl-coenzyme A thioesterase PaaI-like protein [Paracoccaceae bacterium]|jgi:acyl-coenzyme A thioesterase PaaI-like protein
MTAAFDPAADGWTLEADSGFVGFVGPFWRSADGARYGFQSDARHANLIGVVQGGMIMTFADRALGLAAWKAAGDRPCATVQFNAQFVSGVAIGAFVEIAPVVIRSTRSLIFMDGAVMVGDRPAATAQGVWKVVGA